MRYLLLLSLIVLISGCTGNRNVRGKVTQKELIPADGNVIGMFNLGGLRAIPDLQETFIDYTIIDEIIKGKKLQLNRVDRFTFFMRSESLRYDTTKPIGVMIKMGAEPGLSDKIKALQWKQEIYQEITLFKTEDRLDTLALMGDKVIKGNEPGIKLMIDTYRNPEKRGYYPPLKPLLADYTPGLITIALGLTPKMREELIQKLGSITSFLPDVKTLINHASGVMIDMRHKKGLMSFKLVINSDPGVVQKTIKSLTPMMTLIFNMIPVPGDDPKMKTLKNQMTRSLKISNIKGAFHLTFDVDLTLLKGYLKMFRG